MSGSLTGWLRNCVTEPKTMAILASATISAMAVAMYLPAGSFVSASQFAPTVDQVPSDVTVPDQSGGMEIIPRGNGVSGRSAPGTRRTNSATPPGQQRMAPAINPLTVGRRAVLQTPIFSERSPEVRDQVVPLIREQPQEHHASIGQSGIGQQSVGYNYVAASGINSIPYAAPISPSIQAVSEGGSQGQDSVETGTAIPVTGNPTDPLTLQHPTSPVPPVPFEPPASATEAGDTGSAAAQIQSDAAGTVENGARGPGPQIMIETPQVEFGSGPQIFSEPQVLSSYGHAFVTPGTSGFRATVEGDAHAWIDPYRNRTDLLPEGVESTPAPVPSVIMPPGYSAWWDSLVQQRAGIAPRAMPVDVTTLVQQALQYSPQVQVLQADPEVQQMVVRQEEAVFDWKAFLDAKYDDLNDPVGNTLTTGNNSTRFVNNVVNSTGGLKRRTETGGEFRVGQQVGHQYNNSRFLLPNPQATTRLELSFRQPLLSRAGTVYNQNQIILARINANSTGDETLQELQTHLYRVAEIYWKLYRARAEFFQRQKLLASAQKVLTTLDGRNEVDTIPRQILRARAAVARAESRMQRAVTDIRNAESELRLLVNDPAMLNSGPIEFTPTEMPATVPSPTGLRESLQEALINRPDISQAIRQMRASGVRLGVSKSEMLPKLDFIVTSYVAGLQDRTQIGDSFTEQFSVARPGYTVGMEFEVPLGNRAAKAKMEQRQWELKRAINSFRATVETSLTEVEISSREVDTSWRELLGKYQAMLAAQNEVSYLQDRFDVLPAVEESSMLLLEDLLDGYERLADEESAFAQAQANYALSIILLRRTTGMLMRSRFEPASLEPDETEWMSSRVDQAATEVEARDAGMMRTAGLSNARPRIDQTSTPASLSESKGEQPNIDAPKMTAPTPRRRAENNAPQSERSFGGHSFGKGN